MSWVGSHPIVTRTDANKARQGAGLKPCRLCRYWYQTTLNLATCNRCSGDKNTKRYGLNFTYCVNIKC